MLSIGWLTLTVTGNTTGKCNSMPFGVRWAYYGEVLVLVSAA